jgi:hypothetical protein
VQKVEYSIKQNLTSNYWDGTGVQRGFGNVPDRLGDDQLDADLLDRELRGGRQLDDPRSRHGQRNQRRGEPDRHAWVVGFRSSENVIGLPDLHDASPLESCALRVRLFPMTTIWPPV